MPELPKERHRVSVGITLLIATCALVVGFVAGHRYALLPPAAGTHVCDHTGPAAPGTNIDRRISALEKAVEKNPNDLGSWIELGNICFDTDNPDGAIKAYTRALAIDSMNPGVWTDLGTMYRRAGEFPEALDAFGRAREINPKYEAAHFNEGIVLLNDLHNRQGAMKAWETLLAINPEAMSPEGRPVKGMIEALLADTSPTAK